MALLGLELLCAGTAAADPSPATEVSPADAPDQESDAQKQALAHRHFDNGVKLYHDGNFPGALAEFEVAYETNQSAGSLHNVALCQKALFRYSEAVDTLEQLIERFGAHLDPREKEAVDGTIEELSGLVGSIVVHVTPADAQITINGRLISPEELRNGVRLNVGEHTLAAIAPGYAGESRVIRVAGGQDRAVQDMALKPTMGFITVETHDPEAAIAIDGKPLAFEHWQGPVAPGRRLVQAYKQTPSGITRFEERVLVELGKSLTVQAKLRRATRMQLTAPAPEPRFSLASASGPLLSGWYALGSLTLLAVSDPPTNYSYTTANARIGGASGGLRAGYRVLTPIALEAMFDMGRFQGKVCLEHSGCGETQSYDLDTARLGGNLRLMSGGQKLRFTSSFGTGSVRHQLRITAPSTGGEDSKSSGWDPYFLLEVGMQVNFGHLLTEASATVFIDGTGNTAPYEKTGLFFAGLGLRAGWSEWKPPPGSQLRPAGSR